MVRSNVFPLATLLAALSLLTTGCGSSNGSSRVLQSIAVSPATADAQGFPNGQVQFAALGTYSQPPSPVPTTVLNWSLSDTTIATINQTGLAQCNSATSGVVTVQATVPAPCKGTGCTAAMFVGSAKLTCP